MRSSPTISLASNPADSNTQDRVSEGLMALGGQPPRVGDLIQEFRRSLSEGDWYARNNTSEDVRLCQWDGQSDDGRKWQKQQQQGKKVFPWDGASDARTFMADDVCSENAEQKYAAFWRADVRLQGVGPEDIAQASNGTKFLDWLVHGPLYTQLDTEAELAAQYDETFGWFGLHVTWEREIARRPREVTLEQLLALQQQAPELAQANPELAEVLGVFPELMADPTLEKEAVKAVQYLYDLYTRVNLPPGVVEDDVLALSAKRARQAVRELRNDGKTELPVPYLCRNQPSITALKPYRDLIFPPESGDIQAAPVVFVRCFYTEAQLRGMALSNGWDMDWVEAAAKTRGTYSMWTTDAFGNSNRWEWRATEGKSWLIETVWAYYKTVDEDGVSTVDYCVFSPHVENLDDSKKPAHAIAEGLGYSHGKYPVSVGRRERLDRAIGSSRGTPELLQSTQAIEKSQFDSIVDLTSLGVVPPLLVPKGMLGQNLKFGPAVQNEYTPGRETKFMEVPKQGAPLAFTTLEAIYARVRERFGRFHETVNPAQSQLKLEARVKRFLVAWGEALNQAYLLTLQNAPELFERITGAPAPDWIEQTYDYAMHFDAAQLNPDLMAQKLDAYSKLLPEDAAGVIDRAKLMQVKMELIDPALAKHLVSDQAGASQKLFNETQADIAAMAVGMPAPLRDAANDPTSKQRLTFAQQLLKKMPPERVQDPVFQKRLQDYIKNLSMAAQQQDNKMVGRLGVQPER